MQKNIVEGLIERLDQFPQYVGFISQINILIRPLLEKKIGLGQISINLIHDVDLLRYFCGEVKEVYAITSPSIRKYENEDLASVVLKYASGVISTMTVSDSIVSPWS